jgi:hypothetical protein
MLRSSDTSVARYRTDSLLLFDSLIRPYQGATKREAGADQLLLLIPPIGKVTKRISQVLQVARSINVHFKHSTQVGFVLGNVGAIRMIFVTAAEADAGGDEDAFDTPVRRHEMLKTHSCILRSRAFEFSDMKASMSTANQSGTRLTSATTRTIQRGS